jgi:hypothetical protein
MGLRSLKFDPDEPRDEHGRWTTGSGAVVGGKPGEVIGTTSHSESVDLNKLGYKVMDILSSKSMSDLARDAFGIENLQVSRIQGMWEGKPEPSFLFNGKNMSFEAVDGLSKLLGWAFNQDATVVTTSVKDSKHGGVVPAVVATTKTRLTDDQINAITKAANKEGIDFSTTRDAKGIKLLDFTDNHDAFAASAKRIAAAGGLETVKAIRTRSQLNEAENYVGRGISGVGRAEWSRSSGTGGQDLFRRSVDTLIAPYVKAIQEQGYNFDSSKFAERFGHTAEERSIIDRAISAKKYDPNEPRDERGRWTEGEARTQEALDSFEKQYRHAEIEHGIALDDKGNKLFECEGDETHIQFSFNQRMALKSDGAIFDHNHPKDAKFSVGDIQVASEYDLKEIRAVTPDKLYTMTRLDSWPSPPKIAESFSKWLDVWKEKMCEEFFNGTMTKHEAYEAYAPKIWESVASELGMKYTEKKL